ncbi:MAG TPA: type III pantothenate kinase [Ferruginibacter sp.]|nr:type III pantothenate kinase [Ferruginibacter sp.]HMP20607.1 type III pantothenate kinase [Ferruginibacter sp.]
MKTTLCLDFGNTRLKGAVFSNEQLTTEFTLPDDSEATLQAIVQQHKPDKSILSSVIHHRPEVETLLAAATQFHKLSHLSKLNFTAPVSKPDSIGPDRLALCAAAVHYFPGQHNLVIGLGSCITYNFINQQHQFLGGAISPGMEMRFKSMHDYTAKLPLVQKDWNFPVIGYDTKTNLQSGVLAGISFEIDGCIEFYAERYSNFNAVLTGGDTAYFARRLKNRIFADTKFLFKGLYAISEVNNC